VRAIDGVRLGQHSLPSFHAEHQARQQKPYARWYSYHHPSFQKQKQRQQWDPTVSRHDEEQLHKQQQHSSAQDWLHHAQLNQVNQQE